MEQILTIVCKLSPTPEHVAQIEATLKAFANGCNYANEVVKPQTTSSVTIQNLVYQDLRSMFGLSANLAVRVCARVGANRKTAKAKKKTVESFDPTSIDYDARIFDLREKDNVVSLTLMNGRYRIPLDIGEYQAVNLNGKKPTSAQLCKHRDGSYYIHIQIKTTPPEAIEPICVTGVDLGRSDIAVTSDGDADSNGSLNIADLGVPVNVLEGSICSCKLQEHIRAITSPSGRVTRPVRYIYCEPSGETISGG